MLYSCNQRIERLQILLERAAVHHHQVRAARGAGEEFLKCIKNNQKGTLTTEPLALEYVWGEDTSTPNVFHFYEKSS